MDFKSKINLKFNYKKIIKYYYLILMILGAAIYAWLFIFLNDHVLNAISFNNSATNQIMANPDKANDINLNNFNSVMERMEGKTNPRLIKNFKQIF